MMLQRTAAIKETDLIGTRFYKSTALTPELERQSYAVAEWCNAHGAELVDHGDYVEVAYIAAQQSDESLFSSLRARRNELLGETDYLMMPDYPISKVQRTDLASYRQALRDMPAKPGAPWDGGGKGTPWPTKPSV